MSDPFGGGYGGGRGGGGYGGGRGGGGEADYVRPPVALVVGGPGKALASRRDGSPLWAVPCTDSLGADWTVAFTADVGADVRKLGIGRDTDRTGATLVLTDPVPSRGAYMLFVREPGSVRLLGAGEPGSVLSPETGAPNEEPEGGHADYPF